MRTDSDLESGLVNALVRSAATARLAELYAGRPVLLGPGILAGFTPTAIRLHELGCRVLVVSTGRGAGPVPDPRTCEVVETTALSTGRATESVTEELRAHDRLAHDLPAEVVAAVEAFDPERTGIWVTSPFVTTDQPILGRPVTGGRPAAFLALEDKLLAEEVWATTGVPTAPHRIVPVERGALAAATTELAGPLGAVWSGDTRDGFNGGGNFVRWIRDEADQAAAREFFGPRCDRVRVQPFLDGVPCSIHGIVLPDGTAAFRPVEIAILRSPADRRFVYGGLGTYWDPPQADRDQMRAVVRRVGAHLKQVHGYRGSFGVDGVLTADGFRPTELNSRMSAGASTVAAVDPWFFTLLQNNLVAGRDTGVTVSDLESLVPVMDAQRSGKAVAVAEGHRVGGDQSFHLSWDGRAFARSETETGNHFVAADTTTGFFAKVDPCVALAAGDRLAPVNLALLDFLDREFGVGFGPLEAAPDLR